MCHVNACMCVLLEWDYQGPKLESNGFVDKESWGMIVLKWSYYFLFGIGPFLDIHSMHKGNFGLILVRNLVLAKMFLTISLFTSWPLLMHCISHFPFIALSWVQILDLIIQVNHSYRLSYVMLLV